MDFRATRAHVTVIETSLVESKAFVETNQHRFVDLSEVDADAVFGIATISLPDGTPVIECLSGAAPHTALMQKGFYLPERYDWIMIRTEHGYNCLIPLKKHAPPAPEDEDR